MKVLKLDNKFFYIVMVIIILFTILLILFVHLFNTSKETVYPIENFMVCPYENN